MIQNLRQIKNRIRGIQNTRKITHAMEMVAAAKLNKIKTAFYNSRPFFQNMEAVLNRLIPCAGTLSHPLLSKRDSVKNTFVCVIASDTGLCGPYNHNIIRFAEDFLGRYDKGALRLIAVGKEAYSHFNKKNYTITNSYLGLHGKYSQGAVIELAGIMIDGFTSGAADEVYLVYTDFSSALSHRPVAEKILPVDAPSGGDLEYILEQDKMTILNSLIPKYLSAKIRIRFLTSLTSEHSARMFAMKAATDNAEELIDELELQRNKARQAAITKEVLEVAMSAEALKG